MTDDRPRWPSGAYAWLCALVVLAEASVAGAYRVTLGSPAAARASAWALGVALALLFGWGMWMLAGNLRRQRGTAGRARMIALGAFGVCHAVGAAATLAIVGQADLESLLQVGLALSLPAHLQTPALVASSAAALSGLGALVSAASAWPLMTRRTRSILWIVVDGVLLVAVVVALSALPTRPPDDAPDALWRPLSRHIITTLAVFRLTARLVPLALNAIERIGFRPMVAARHLRARKSGFLATISVLSILAVTVSSCALTTTLSVMGGFRNDLKRKILGNHAHIVVDRPRGAGPGGGSSAYIEGWAPLVEGLRPLSGVAGAAPFVSGEVMLSSTSNHATAILRGIDPDSVGQVSDLPDNMRSGSIDYLQEPERLLELPASSLAPLGRSLLGDLPPPDDDGPLVDRLSAEDEAPPSPPLAGGSPKNPPATGAGDAPAPTPDPRDAPDQPDADEHEEQDDLAEFLAPRSAGAREPQVLPGIIIGRELARALRLHLGDDVNVVAPLGALGPAGPMPKARPFRVAGIFYSGMYEYDMKYTYVSLDAAQRFLGIGDAISGIEVKAHDAESAGQLASVVKAALDGEQLRVRDWRELNSRLFGALALERLAMFIILFVAVVVASFCIIGSLTLMVQEKGREVAVLKALGTADRSVVGVFVLEGGLIGIFGALLGLFLGYMVCFAVEHLGIIRLNPEVYYIDRLPIHVDPAEFGVVGLAAVLVCLLVTVYPALLASRLRPVDALRYE